MTPSPDSAQPFKLMSVEDFEPLVGAGTIDRILHKAEKLRDLHVTHINSTLKDQKLRDELGRNARESVIQNFLLTRLMEEWLDLIGSFHARFLLRSQAE